MGQWVDLLVADGDSGYASRKRMISSKGSLLQGGSVINPLQFCFEENLSS